MKFNKLFLCLLLTLCLMLSLCACASKEEDTDTKAQPEATTEAPADEDPTTEAPSVEEPESEEASDEVPTTAAISDSPYAEEIIGVWDWEIDTSKLMVDKLSESMGMDLSEKGANLNLVFHFYFDFAEDGTCKAYFDKDALTASFDTFLTDLSVVMEEVTYEQVAAQGVSKEDADANFMQQYGCGIGEYYDELLHSSLNLDSMFGNLPSMEGNYKLEGDQLMISETSTFNDDALTIAIDGDQMTFDGDLDESILNNFDAYGIDFPITLVRK